jgi:hypothetical protein
MTSTSRRGLLDEAARSSLGIAVSLPTRSAFASVLICARDSRSRTSNASSAHVQLGTSANERRLRT